MHSWIGSSITSRLQTIVRNNQSLTEFFVSNHLIDARVFDALHANGILLRKHAARVVLPGDILELAKFKNLQYLRVGIQDKEYQTGISLKEVSQAIGSLEELVDLTLPSYLKVDFERLPKLRRLQLTDHASAINIRSDSLDLLDISSSFVSFAMITCRNLTVFRTCRELVILQLNAPKLEVFPPIPRMNNVVHLSVRSHSLSSFSLSYCGNIESCILDTPALRSLTVSWEDLNGHSAMMSLVTDNVLNKGDKPRLSPDLHNVDKLTIETGMIAVDESCSRTIASFPHLDDLRISTCDFYDDDYDDITPVPSVTRLELFQLQGFELLVRQMDCLFPNVRQFSIHETMDM